MTPAAIPAVYPSLPDSGRWPDGWQCAAGRRRSFGWCRRPPRSSLRRRRGATVVGTARRGGPTACRCTICGGRNCGVDLSVENVDRPRPDQQRSSGLPAGVPSTSSTGHPRGACRDKAMRRRSASTTDDRVLTPRPLDPTHSSRLVTDDSNSRTSPRSPGAASDSLAHTTGEQQESVAVTRPRRRCPAPASDGTWMPNLGSRRVRGFRDQAEVGFSGESTAGNAVTVFGRPGPRWHHRTSDALRDAFLTQQAMRLTDPSGLECCDGLSSADQTALPAGLLVVRPSSIRCSPQRYWSVET